MRRLQAVAAALLVAGGKSAQAQSKSAGQGRGKSPAPVVGVDRLVMDQRPSKSAKVCADRAADPLAKSPDALSIAPMQGASSVQVTFEVSHVTPSSGSEPMLLFLAYSKAVSSSPTLVSKNEAYPFKLEGGLNILTAYRLSPLSVQPQAPVSIGTARGEPAARISFLVDLPVENIRRLIASGENRLYFQAGLLPVADLERGDYKRMILSEVDAIAFTERCSGSNEVSKDASGRPVTPVPSPAPAPSSGKTIGTGGGKSSMGSTSDDPGSVLTVR